MTPHLIIGFAYNHELIIQLPVLITAKGRLEPLMVPVMIHSIHAELSALINSERY